VADTDRGRALVAETERLLETQRSGRVLRLARAVSLAVSVEPALLRRARVVLVPGADAGTESELWFSPLVLTRNATGLVLDPDALAVLRSDLATGVEGSGFATRAHEVVEELHADLPDALGLEEDLIWAAVRHEAGEESLEPATAALRLALASMLEHEDGGRRVARWASQALGRLPDSVTATEAAKLLAVGASLRIGQAGAAARIAEQRLPASISWLVPSEAVANPVELGVELADGGLRFVEPTPGALIVELPSTSPVVAEVSWEGESRLLAVEPGTEVPGATGAITLRTLAGRRYVIEPEVAPGEGTAPLPGDVERLRRSCVQVITDLGAGMGYAIADDLVATTVAFRRAGVLTLRWGTVEVRATEVLAAARVMMLRPAQPLPARPLGLSPTTSAREGDTWTSFASPTDLDVGMVVSGRVVGGALEITEGAKFDLAGAPVLIGGLFAGQVATDSGGLELIPAEQVVAAVATPRRTVDFAISAAPRDQAWVDWITWLLTDAGYDVGPAAQARSVVAVISGAARAGPDVGPDVEVLPVRVADVVVLEKGVVDLVGLDEPLAVRALLATVQRLRKPPTTGSRWAGAQPGFPGRPTTWNIPEADGDFVGRESTMVDLEAFATRPIALCGPAGIGKSRIAIEFAHRHAGEYDVAWWVRARSDLTRIDDYTALADALGLPEAADPNTQRVVAAIKRWFAEHDRWLLVLDEAPSPEAVADLLPAGPGHVLVTSEWSIWDEAATPVLLQPLSRPDAVQLLEARADRSGDPAAGSVVEIVGGTPLTLELAAAFVASREASFTDYYRLLRRASEGRWQLQAMTVLSLSMDVLTEMAREMLLVCAFLAPEPLPRKSLFPDAREPAVAALERLRLVTATPDQLSVHPLVQDVVRSTMTGGTRPERASAAEALLGDALRDRLVDELLPHALAVVDHVVQLDLAGERTIDILQRVAARLQQRGDLFPAKVQFERAVVLASRLTHLDARTQAVALTQLGVLQTQLGELAAAEQSLEAAVALAEGVGDESVVPAITALGGFYRTRGDTETAVTVLRRALSEAERRLGPEHPWVGLASDNLGTALLDIDDLAGALAAFERAIAIYGAHDDEASGARVLNHLGTLFAMRGDLAEARQAIERSLTIEERVHGPEHPAFAAGLQNLATVLLDMGDTDGARQAAERALVVQESVLGADHPDVAATLETLASTARDPDYRRGALTRAVAIYEQTYGPDDARTLRVRNALDPPR
jgi:tetratricopeptide (TPR) repeat protein